LAWTDRCAALENLGRLEEALTSCNKSLELRQDRPLPFFNRAEVLLELNRWDEGYAALDEALSRFAHAAEPDTGDPEEILDELFGGRVDPATWRERIAALIALYDKHQVLSALGQGLVQHIRTLTSPMVSTAAARTWRDLWQELGSKRAQLQLPLRLLDAAIRYQETQDLRVMLELPIEERTLLEPLVRSEKPSEIQADTR
jgi:tetratricopeptide (TPR) repeat protein